MKRFIEGESRQQVTLLPECLDDYIGEDNPVRIVDAFVEELDLLSLGFKGADPASTGRPAYHPAVLLKLYIYGYLNRIQSSRRLEREAQRNVELMWLTGRLAPDFKTIADFRHNNALGIRNVCRRFVGLCRELKLFSQAIVAIDGSKFKAVNSRDRNVTPAEIEARQRQIEESIQRYLDALETADRTQPANTAAGRESRPLSKPSSRSIRSLHKRSWAKRTSVTCWRRTMMTGRRRSMSSEKETKGGRRGGRKEVLTLEMAKKIAVMIRRLPDAEVPVTWKNIEAHVTKRFQIAPKRNVLTTKKWGGRRLIWEAYDEAGQVEKRLQRQTTSKYADSSRTALRARITELEAKIISLQMELHATREHQYDELCVLWARNTPLHKLLDDQPLTS